NICSEPFSPTGAVSVQENYSVLRDRAVAYINVDISVYANATLQVSGSPAAQGVVFAAAKQVQAPGPGSLSVYENWKRFANRTSPAHGVIPSMGYLTGAGSDYASFMHFLGITSMDVSYTYDKVRAWERGG
uniref:Uncharacterized protein n=1 Tax=Lepisosteus oculatus TaxID=7918 RepID=W5M2G2_LEPOC